MVKEEAEGFQFRMMAPYGQSYFRLESGLGKDTGSGFKALNPYTSCGYCHSISLYQGT